LRGIDSLNNKIFIRRFLSYQKTKKTLRVNIGVLGMGFLLLVAG